MLEIVERMEFKPAPQRPFSGRHGRETRIGRPKDVSPGVDTVDKEQPGMTVENQEQQRQFIAKATRSSSVNFSRH